MCNLRISIIKNVVKVSVSLKFTFTQNGCSANAPKIAPYTHSQKLARRYEPILAGKPFYYCEISQTYREMVHLSIRWKWNPILVKVNLQWNLYETKKKSICKLTANAATPWNRTFKETFFSWKRFELGTNVETLLRHRQCWKKLDKLTLAGKPRNLSAAHNYDNFF